jgi:hypothetical protein
VNTFSSDRPSAREKDQAFKQPICQNELVQEKRHTCPKSFLSKSSRPAVTNAPPFRVTPTRRPLSLLAVVDALHCGRARPGRGFRNGPLRRASVCRSGLRAAALRSPLRYALRSDPPFRSRSPPLTPKRPRTDCPQPQPSRGVIRRRTSLSECPVLLRQAGRKERNHENGLPVRLICA